MSFAGRWGGGPGVTLSAQTPLRFIDVEKLGQVVEAACRSPQTNFLFKELSGWYSPFFQSELGQQLRFFLNEKECLLIENGIKARIHSIGFKLVTNSDEISHQEKFPFEKSF